MSPKLDLMLGCAENKIVTFEIFVQTCYDVITWNDKNWNVWTVCQNILYLFGENDKQNWKCYKYQNTYVFNLVENTSFDKYLDFIDFPSPKSLVGFTFPA